MSELRRLEGMFISDIAAFECKPVFITGCTVTAIFFALTVWAVHYARYPDRCYGLTRDAGWKKTISGLALVSGLWAAVSLLLLTVFDTYRAHERHQYLLLSCLGGLGISMLTTSTVWFDQTWKVTQWKGLGRWCGP
ncbi:hypothetical protein H2204_007556 [Knufia peltigerae]|uniref:CWH43-like N-terminal domain-containing protein n=1 Tax=Knufia peltigerae TaxID=1002370 RepID=A0AA38Y1S7_9EURO|nr:hypothetical protein H2204_007556 [Knufia peltigerae]